MVYQRVLGYREGTVHKRVDCTDVFCILSSPQPQDDVSGFPITQMAKDKKRKSHSPTPDAPQPSSLNTASRHATTCQREANSRRSIPCLTPPTGGGGGGGLHEAFPTDRPGAALGVICGMAMSQSSRASIPCSPHTTPRSLHIRYEKEREAADGHLGMGTELANQLRQMAHGVGWF